MLHQRTELVGEARAHADLKVAKELATHVPTASTLALNSNGNSTTLMLLCDNQTVVQQLQARSLVTQPAPVGLAVSGASQMAQSVDAIDTLNDMGVASIIEWIPGHTSTCEGNKLADKAADLAARAAANDGSGATGSLTSFKMIKNAIKCRTKLSWRAYRFRNANKSKYLQRVKLWVEEHTIDWTKNEQDSTRYSKQHRWHNHKHVMFQKGARLVESAITRLRLGKAPNNVTLRQGGWNSDNSKIPSTCEDCHVSVDNLTHRVFECKKYVQARRDAIPTIRRAIEDAIEDGDVKWPFRDQAEDPFDVDEEVKGLFTYELLVTHSHKPLRKLFPEIELPFHTNIPDSTAKGLSEALATFLQVTGLAWFLARRTTKIALEQTLFRRESRRQQQSPQLHRSEEDTSDAAEDTSEDEGRHMAASGGAADPPLSRLRPRNRQDGADAALVHAPATLAAVGAALSQVAKTAAESAMRNIGVASSATQ